jgi:hypothetical protein
MMTRLEFLERIVDDLKEWRKVRRAGREKQAEVELVAPAEFLAWQEPDGSVWLGPKSEKSEPVIVQGSPWDYVDQPPDAFH